jgi:hypothetical protein
MNLATRERQLGEPYLPPGLPARIRHLEFNDVRAGRLMAESIFDSATEYLEKALVRSQKVWEVVAREVPFTALRPPVPKVPVMHIRWQPVDIDFADVLLPRRNADVALVMPADDEDDDAILEWFVEQHAAATQAAPAQPEVVTDVEDDGEVMLTLRYGSGTTRSWRGGGTMRQR